MPQDQPTVVIVGAGFGGISAARALKSFSGRVILIDRQNHHLFQPLLYQVATCVLSPEQISTPIRDILAGQKNTVVIQGEVTSCNPAAKQLTVSNSSRSEVALAYDYLILATGVSLNYFGHPSFEQYAPGMKNLSDAIGIRNRILGVFELAEAEEDPTKHQDLLTIALIGAGPTGVELAGALAIMVRDTLKQQFRRIDPLQTRIILVDSGARLLATFDAKLSEKAQQRLDQLGVETLHGHHVEEVTAEGFRIGDQWVPCRTVIWTAGVTPSPAAKWLSAPTDRAGRVRVAPDLTVPNHPDVFIIGDIASLDQDGHTLPGVAQVALQQGHYAARVIQAKATGSVAPPPFRYFDKGNLAVVGRGFAILQSGPAKSSGLFAWFVWAFVHLRFLAQPGLRLTVFLQWLWIFFTRQRGARLIVRPYADR